MNSSWLHLLLILCVVWSSARAQTNVFSSTGNAGAGTTTPATLLEVYGDGTDSQDLFRVTRGGWNASRLQFGHSYIQRYDGSGNPAALLLNLNGGNVGIGTASPAFALDIRNDQDASTYAVVRNSATGVTSASGFYATNDTNSGVSLTVQGTQTSSIGELIRPNYGALSTDSAISGFTIGTAGASAPLIFGTANSERMRITGSGSIGVGTNVVEAGVHLKARFSGLPAASGTAQTNAVLRVQPTDTNLVLDLGAQSGSGAWLQASNRADLAQNFALLLNPNGGNVGIGTISPTHKLAVNGTIRAKEVIVDNTGWADHVFAADYRLAPLSEVEQHIQQRGHLPDVPSAAEVAARGVSVGEMQKILLQKIEELTLHQIEQEKRINSQAERIRALETENAQLRTR